MKEIELNRYFKSVEAFWSYCEKMCKKHDITLTDWICDIEQFKNPLQKSNYRDNVEVCKLQPYDMQLFYRGSYNFIMEYDFWDDKEGHGYLYVKEF